MTRGSKAQSKYWCWTYNFEEDAHIDGATEFASALHTRLEAEENISYCVFQLESGVRQNRLHLQGYLETNTRIRRAGCIRLLGEVRFHCELRLGNAEQASSYCQKEESRQKGPWICGTISTPKQGERTDLNQIRDSIRKGATELDIADEHFGSWCRYHKSFGLYRSLVIPQRSWKTKTVVLYGPTGTGKSRFAWGSTEAGNIYTVPRSTGDALWFDGYDPGRHTTIILDDFYGWVRLNVLLQLLDRYPMRVPTKGGFTNWCPRFAFITSNVEWSNWYKFEELKGGEELKAALERRLDIVYNFLVWDLDNLVLNEMIKNLE